MKKTILLTFLFSLFFTPKGFGQIEHMKFMGIPIDGLNEAENALHQQFGDERILQLAEEQLAKGEYQPMPLIQRMSAAVHFFAGAAEQSDDLTMLAIQYKKEYSEPQFSINNV